MCFKDAQTGCFILSVVYLRKNQIIGTHNQSDSLVLPWKAAKWIFLCISYINMKSLRYVYIIFHDCLFTNFFNEPSSYSSPLCLMKAPLMDHQLGGLWNRRQPKEGSLAHFPCDWCHISGNLFTKTRGVGCSCWTDLSLAQASGLSALPWCLQPCLL